MNDIENCSDDLREFLEDNIDPDYGLLEKLGAKEILRRREIADIETKDTFYKRNTLLLNLIAKKKATSELCLALKRTRQIHIVNYFISNGEYKPEFKDDWPLGEKEHSILNVNENVIIEILNTEELAPILYAQNILNKRQRETILSLEPDSKKNKVLLQHLRRFSRKDYKKTIDCLIQSNQRHIAELLRDGGAVVRVHSDIGESNEETEAREDAIISQFQDKTLEDLQRTMKVIWKLIELKKGQSIVLFIYCFSYMELFSLKLMIHTGKLRKAVLKLFNDLLNDDDEQSPIKAVTVSLSEAECNKCMSFLLKCEESHSSTTVLDSLPFELLDIILQKTCLYSILKQGKKSNEILGDVIIELATVNFLWLQRINRKRFKKAIWSLLSRFYKSKCRATRMSIVYRNNKQILENIIQLQDVAKYMKSTDCLSDVQYAILNRGRIHAVEMKKSRNRLTNLFEAVNFLDETKFASFIHCLRKSKSKLMAGAIEYGGVSLKIEVKRKERGRRAKSNEDFLKRHEIRLKDVETLHAVEDRDAVIWIWCKSQNALEGLKQQNAANNLLDNFNNMMKGYQSMDETKDINIDLNETRKEIVSFPISVKLTTELCLFDEIKGVTKLRNQIYAVCKDNSESETALYVFQDKSPYQLLKQSKAGRIDEPLDIGSSEKDNCIYVIDGKSNRILKVTEGRNMKYKTVKWQEFEDFKLLNLSVSTKGQLLMIGVSQDIKSNMLRLYSSNAELCLSIQLDNNISSAIHAVETSYGNFILIHKIMRKMIDIDYLDTKNERFLEEKIGSSEEEVGSWTVSELCRKSGNIIRHMFDTNEKLKFYPRRLCIDSYDRVFVLDGWNKGVIILDADLKWNQIIDLPTEDDKECDINNKGDEDEDEDEEEDEDESSWSLCYDEEIKQLVVGRSTENLAKISFYTLTEI